MSVSNKENYAAKNTTNHPLGGSDGATGPTGATGASGANGLPTYSGAGINAQTSSTFSISTSGAFTLSASTLNLGQGTVTQLTSITTNVTMNSPSGVISLFNGGSVNPGLFTFTMNNSCIKSTSAVLLSGESTSAWQVVPRTVANGSVQIQVVNQTSIALPTSGLKIHFLIV